MSDVRRLNVDEKPVEELKHVEATPVEAYRLDEERSQAIENALPEILQLPYWSPEYQAWEPFLFDYFRSGAVPHLAEEWLTKLTQKAILEDIAPPKCSYREMYEEVKKFYKSNTKEVFVTQTWDEIIEFVEWIPNYIDNMKSIQKYLFNEENYTTLLKNLLEMKSASEKEQGYSNNLHFAVYLYRHCMIDYYEHPLDVVEEIDRQCNVYADRFNEAFTLVSNFLAQSLEVYKWYSPKVQSVINKSWRTAADLTDKRDVLSMKDVVTLPVWVSEQLTQYINTLPCNYTLELSDGVLLDALEYTLRKGRSLKDPLEVFGFCVPKSYLKRFMEDLSLFYWDVKEDRFVPSLYLHMKTLFFEHHEGALSPEDALDDLLSRGFPVKEDI